MNNQNQSTVTAWEVIGDKRIGGTIPYASDHQILIIVKDSQIAFYLQGKPMAYYQDDRLSHRLHNYPRIYNQGEEEYFLINQVEFWDLEKIP
jgi:hypothetical protein